jgi:hypothetical protein
MSIRDRVFTHKSKAVFCPIFSPRNQEFSKPTLITQDSALMTHHFYHHPKKPNLDERLIRR